MVDCAICLEPLDNKEDTIVTLCSGVDENGVEWNHKFHRKCIIGWINQPINAAGLQCPLCRRIVRHEDLQALPDDMWRPMEIAYDGVTIVIAAAMVRQFVLAYHYVDEYEIQSQLSRIAFRKHYNSSRVLHNLESRGPMPTIDQITNARYTAHQNKLASDESLTGLMTGIHDSQFTMESIKAIALLIILVNFLRFKFTRRPQIRGGGKTLCINGECIEVPGEFSDLVSERLSALKKSPILLKNGQLGGTLRRRKTRKNKH